MAFDFNDFQKLVAAEAGNQDIEGQQAVASVILNRMSDDQFPNDFTGVASQKNQFEPWRKFGGFENMPNLTKSQQASLRDFVSNYSPETDPTGGALFFQNPTITASRGTKFDQPDGIKIGDQVFSRTFGRARGKNKDVAEAKRNILSLTKGHPSESQGRQIVSTFSDDDIIAASNKFNQALSNLNPTFSGGEPDQTPVSGEIPLEEIDMTGATGQLPQGQEQDINTARNAVLEGQVQGQQASALAPPQDFKFGGDEAELKTIHDSYFSGGMSEAGQKSFEQDVLSGAISAPTVPDDIYQAYTTGAMSEEGKRVFEQDIQSGLLKFGQGQQLIPPPQEKTFGEKLQTQAELTTRAVLGGLEGALGIVYNPVAVMMNQAISDEKQIPMLGSRINNLLTEAGFAEPEGLTQEIVNRVGEAMVGAGGVTKAAQATIPVTRGAAQLVSRSLAAQPAAQITSAAGGELAGEAARKAGAGTVGQTVASILGAVATGSVPTPRTPKAPKPKAPKKPEDLTAAEIGTLVNKASAGGRGAPDAAVKLAEAAKVNVAAKEAADRLGIKLPADVLSDETIVKQAAGLTRSKVGTVASAAWEDTVKNAVTKADDVLFNLSNKKSISEVSENVKKSLDDSLESIKIGENKLYTEVRDEVGARTKIDAANTRAYLSDKVKDLGGVAKLDAGDKALYLEIFNPHKQPNFAVIDRAIRKINAAQSGKQNNFSDANDFDLDQLADNLRKDRISHVEKFGGDATRKKLTSAHELTARKKELQKQLISGFGRDQQGSLVRMLNTSITNAKKGDASGLNKVLNIIPKDLQKESILAAINQSATSRVGGKQVFGFSQYADFYSGLRKNPPLYNKIIGVIGKESHKTLRDLFSVSKRITDARGKVITTGKANQELVGAITAENLVNRIMQSSIGGKAVKGAAAGGGAAVGGVTGAAGGAALADLLARGGKDRIAAAGKLFASDEFKDLAVNVATNPNHSRNSVKLFAKTDNFMNWAKSSNITNPERWLLGVIFPNQRDEEPKRKGVHMRITKGTLEKDKKK